jgi:basic membrane lipoprotein Med (substrate-binding protein (PBP1-ABC) superfamily)
MHKKKFWFIIMVLIMVFSLLAACAPAAEEPATEEPAAEEPAAEEPAMEEPTALKAIIFTSTSLEEPWNSVYTDSWDRIAAEKPHGLDITYDIAESVATADIARVMLEYYNTGDYDIFVFHDGGFNDASIEFDEDHPEELIAADGSVFEPRGGNYFHSNVYVHECAYLLGILAGHMTETNKLGAVGAFPYPNVNLPINAFFDGAKSVNPDISQVVTYIESWWDPPKGAESAAAQIAAGADLLYAERFGPFEAAKDAGVLAFGHYNDQHDLAPDVVVSSTIGKWDPSIMRLIDMWWAYNVDGTPYDAPTETYLPTMAEGVCDIAPYYNFEDVIPQDAKDAVEEAKQAILSGELVVPANEAQVESDF